MALSDMKKAGAVVKKEPVGAKKTADQPNKAAAAKKVKEVPSDTQEKEAPKKGTTKPPRVKKEYDLPGQTRDTPPENEPLRKFYTSLLEQRPDSEMAMKWCVQHGLLPAEKAQAWLDQQPRRVTGAKSPSKGAAAGARGGSRTPAKRKTAVKEEDDDDDEDDFKKPVAKKRAAPAAKKSGAAGTAAKKTTVKKEQPEWSDDDDDDDKPLVARKRPGVTSAAAPIDRPVSASRPPLIPRKQQVPVKRDVAFADGGLGSDSDDDVPLAVRRAPVGAQ
ncbi:hypothetical protein N2152v2_000550 [Parachlorella kessleri]